MELRPPRGRRRPVSGIADPRRSREHQPGLDRPHRRRRAADPGHRQRLAAGLGLPAGTSGTITLSFASNAVYRAGIVGGLALLPILALLALVPARRPPPPADPARPWQPPPVVTALALLARRRGDLRRRRRGGGGRGVGRSPSAAPSTPALRGDHRRNQCLRADPGRRGAVPESVAIGGRLRRALVERSTACADIGRCTGGSVIMVSAATQYRPRSNRHRRPRRNADA